MSPFMYTAGNPVMLIDPNGMETIKMDDEFGINGEKISDYGGDKTDYHHQKNGTVVIKDHKSGKEKGSMPVGAFYAGKQINSYLKSENSVSNSTPSTPTNSSGSLTQSNTTNADLSGFSSATGGFLLAGATEILDGSSVRFFRSSGTIFSPKLYTSGWIGGSRGNIITYGTSKLATGLRTGSYGLGVFNAYSIHNQYTSGQISGFQYGLEQGSNLYSTLGGLYGAAWGFGWEGGRTIAQTEPYLDFKFWFQKDVLGWDVKRSQMCTACPK